MEFNNGEPAYHLRTHTSDSEKSESLYALWEACYREHMEALGYQLALQNGLSVEDEARLAQAVISCLQGHGIAVTKWPGVDVPVDPATEAECYDDAVADLGAGE